MAQAKTAVQQLKTLASEPENVEYIINDETCFNGLVRFLESSDSEIVFSALEVLNSLSSDPKNRKDMVKHIDLMANLKKLMIDFNATSNMKKMASNIYASLQIYVDKVPITPTKLNKFPFDLQSDSNAPLRDATNTFGTCANPHVISVTPREYSVASTSTSMNSNSGSGFSFFSERISTSLPTAKTYTIYIKGMNTELVKIQLEKELLHVRGIVSFSLDVKSRRATIRASSSGNDLVSTIRKSTGLEATLFPNAVSPNTSNPNQSFDFEKENEPQYLPEPSQSSWFSSIVSWGYSDKKKKAEPSKKQTNNTILGTLTSIGEALNLI